MTRKARDERGVVVPIVAVAIVMLIGVAAFVVDLGMQRVLRRDLQAVADMVSMDLVRSLDGRQAGAYQRSELDRARDLSVARTAGSVVGDPPVVTYELGTVDAQRVFTVSTPTQVPQAVRVTATGRVGFAFAQGAGGSSGSAVAVALPTACFSVGSYAARVRLNDQTILGPLLSVLGTGVDLDLLDLQGLAGASIDLLDLAGADVGAGGFDQLLTASTTLGDFYLAVADVLARQSGQTAQVALLQQLAQAAVPGLDLTLGELIDLDTGVASAITAQVNLLDLVAGAAFVANGQNALGLPSLTTDIVGLSTLTSSLVLGSRPRIACGRVGRARAATDQVHLDVTGNVVNLNLGLASVAGPIDIDVAVAPAEGTLTGLTCATRSKRLQLATAGGALDLTMRLTLRIKIAPILLGGITVADVPVEVTTGRSSAPGSVSIDIVDEVYGATASTGQGSLGAPALSVDTSGLRVLGLPLGTLTDVIVTPLLERLLNPLVAALDRQLLSPLLESLGVNVAGADYASVPKATCGTPALRG